jgi:hypothetical protein
LEDKKLDIQKEMLRGTLKRLKIPIYGTVRLLKSLSGTELVPLWFNKNLCPINSMPYGLLIGTW